MQKHWNELLNNSNLRNDVIERFGNTILKINIIEES